MAKTEDLLGLHVAKFPCVLQSHHSNKDNDFVTDFWGYMLPGDPIHTGALFLVVQLLFSGSLPEEKESSFLMHAISLYEEMA